MAEVTKLFGDGIVFLTTYAVIGLALGTAVRLGIWMADLWIAHRDRQRPGWIVEHMDKDICRAEINRRNDQLAARAQFYSTD